MKSLLLYSLLLLLLSLTNPITAQTSCNDTPAILNIKGKWYHSKDYISDAGMNAKDKNEISKTIDQLYSLVLEAYPNPLGCEPGWYRQIFNIKYESPFKNGPYPFGFASFYSKYSCDIRVKDLYLVKETGTWAWIFANRLHWFLSKSDTVKINGKQLYVRAGYKGELNGMPLYESFNNGKALLLSRPGELPYTSVTRRKYLEMKLGELKERKSNNIERIMKTKIRSDKEHEAEKQKELEKIDRLFARYPEKKREEAKQRYLKGFKTDVERRDENLKRSNDSYDKDIKRYQDELNNTSPELLESPACLDKTAKNILADEKAGGLMFVTLNEEYINRKLPATVPQFFLMVWTHTEKHIASRYFKNEWETKFPFEKLRAMIR